MKITVCYPGGRTPLSDVCRVFGFGEASHGPGSEWVPYAVFDMPDPGRMRTELIKALAMFEVEYRDETFSSTVPGSANVTAGLIETLLARSDFIHVPYRLLTRQRNADFCTEIVRRTVPASAITEP